MSQRLRGVSLAGAVLSMLLLAPPHRARGAEDDAGRALQSPSSEAVPEDLAARVRVRVGAAEVVMDYSADSCREAGGMDLPDVQARAFRRPGDDHIVLLSGNAPAYYVMVGPDFDRLRRDCNAVLVSGDRPDAASFDNQEWLLSAYRDGRTVHALVHNEYHDPQAANCRPGVSDTSNPCWYNAITYAVSLDAGRSFTQVSAPDHVVAALPSPWDPAAGLRSRGAPPPHGYFTPSNMIRGPDGYVYSMFMAIPDAANPAQGTCVMRTNQLSEPRSWRAWDGSRFDLPMPSPYDRDHLPAPTGRPPCAPVSPRTIGSLHGSLTYSTYLQRYVLVGSGAYRHEGETTCGTYFALSTDLVHWSAPRLILPGKLPYPPCNVDGTPSGSLIYPSLIDHASMSLNFETTGRRPHLYFVRWNEALDRDLMRVGLVFDHPGTLHLPLALRGSGPLPLPTGTPSPTAVPPAAGVERVVVLLVEDGGSTDPRLDVEATRAVLDDVRAWYEEVSYGRAEFVFDVRGWFEIPVSAGSSTDPRIYDAALAAGVDFTRYDHVLVLFHGGSGHGSSNSNHNVLIRSPDGTHRLAATVSMVTRLRDTSGTRGVIAHELGHALGLPHANHLSQLSGKTVVYGTRTDAMGSSASLGHFNAYYKWSLGWLDALGVVTATTGGVFHLEPQELDAGLRLLVVPVDGEGDRLGRSTLTDYVVEVRRAIGRDARLLWNTLDGALLYRLERLPVLDPESMARIQVVSMDASPETPSQYSDDFGLMPGRTFSDAGNGIHITVLHADEHGAVVQVVRDEAAGNRPPEITALRAVHEPTDPAAVRLLAEAVDPDGDELSVFWNLAVVGDPGSAASRGKVTRFGPGTYASGPETRHTFDDTTPRTVCVLVSDRRGGLATDCLDLYGAQVGPPVVRAASAPRGPGLVGLQAHVTHSLPTWVWWDFGDGTGSAFVAVEHAYKTPGAYTARVTAGDGRHHSSSEVAVDATQRENMPPVADAGPDQTASPGQTVVLDGSASYDPDRYPIAGLRFIWTPPAGIRLADPRAARTTFSAPAALGAYTFTLQVYDGALYAADETTVTVR